MSSRFDYLKNQDDEEPKTFEKIPKKKPKPYDDGTSRHKPEKKRRKRKK